MTVAELKHRLADYEDTDPVPLDEVCELSYVVSALEEWQAMQEIHGRTFHPEIDRFLRDARRCL